MKLTNRRALFVLALALGAGAVGSSYAQSSPVAQDASPAAHHDRGGFRHRHHHHHGHFRNYRAGFRHFRGGRGGSFLGSLVRATRQLDLTADQRTSLQSILKSARPTRQPGAQPQRPSMTVLGNPGDPGYAAAVQRAAADASSRIQKQSELAGKIYAVLTPAQQKQLPTVLASMQSREQGRGGRGPGRRGRDNDG